MELMFRRATSRDGAAARQLIEQALRDYGLSFRVDDGDRDVADIEQHYDARGGCFELLEAGG
ncbi:MAG TPA: hypothetical protein VGD37_05735, partial [Kofleriaceae bacterium]